MKASMLIASAVVLGLIPATSAATFNWKGGDAPFPTRWSRAANWVENDIPKIDDSVKFLSTGVTSVTIPSNASAHDIEFVNGAQAYTFTSGSPGSKTLRLGTDAAGSGIVNNSANTQTFGPRVNVDLKASQTWNAASGNLILNGSIGSTANPAATLTLQSGAGKSISLGGNNTYNGPTVITSGSQVNANSGGALAKTSQTTLNGALNIAAGLTFASAGGLELGNGGSLTLGNAAKASFAGALTLNGNSAINLAGATLASLTFPSASRASGSLTVNGWLNDLNRDKIFVNAAPANSFLVNVNFTGFGSGAKMIGNELIPASVTPVPEPQAFAAVVAAGLLGFAAYRRRCGKI